MPRGASTDGQRRHRGGIARCRYLFFRRAGPRARRASHDRRRLVRARHWTARPARRDRDDAYAGRPRPDRTLAISPAACGRRSPERPGERSGLPACHVRRGRPRRYARPAPQTRRAARRRSGPVRGRVSALLRPRPRGHSHRAGRANRLTPNTPSGVIPELTSPDTGVHDLVADAVGVLDAYEIQAAHVVGVSAGGAFALLALGFPDRGLSLVLVSTPWRSQSAARSRRRPSATEASAELDRESQARSGERSERVPAHGPAGRTRLRAPSV